MSFNYKVSRYTHLIPTLDGATLIFNALSCGLAQLDAQTFSRYQKFVQGEAQEIDEELLRQLKTGGFIVPSEMDEIAYLRSMHYQARFSAKACVLTIAPTLECNFACDYCYEAPHKRRQGNAIMTLAVQDALIQFAEQQLSGKQMLGVSWYGGEPLLCLKVVEGLTQKFQALCERRQVSFLSNMVTNGYLLTPDTQAQLLQLGIRNLQVTLDGPEKIHDERRPLRSGKGSYQQIIRNLTTLDDQLRVSLRVNLDKRNRAHIPTLLQDLVAHGLHRKPNLLIYFAPVAAVNVACHDSVSTHCYSTQEFADLQRAIIDEAVTLGVPVLSYPGNLLSSCGAVSPHSFVIDSSGALYKCWETIGDSRKQVGHVSRLSSNEESARASNWHGWNPFIQECESCSILPTCMSGCPYRTLFREELAAPSQDRCTPLKHNLNQALLTHYRAKTDSRTANLVKRPGR